MATPKSKKPSKGAPKPPFYLPKKGQTGSQSGTQKAVQPSSPQTGPPQYPAKPLPSSKGGPKASTGKQTKYGSTPTQKGAPPSKKVGKRPSPRGR